MTTQYLKQVEELMIETLEIDSNTLRGQDALWEEWLGYKDRYNSDLRRLIFQTDVNLGFKARAVIAFFAPNLSDVEPRIENFERLVDFVDGEFLALLSGKMQLFAMKLLLINIPITTEMIRRNNQISRVQYKYNELILTALRILPAEDPVAIALFEHYSLNDFIAVGLLGSAYGYTPFGALLSSDAPVFWKRYADTNMRDRIIAESRGEAEAKEAGEEAFGCYVAQIGRSLALCYDRGLLASQVQFILEQAGIRKTFNAKQFETVLQILDPQQEDYRSVCRDLVLHMVTGKFTLSTGNKLRRLRLKSDNSLFDRIMERFNDDEEVCDAVLALIDELNAEEQQRREKDKEENESARQERERELRKEVEFLRRMK